jgi:UDP-N-acetylmuramoyl-tripeptide--D-alanyl-D-alanine ligase
VPVNVPLLGRHSVYTALAAAAVGLSQAMSWDEIVPGLQDKRAQLRLMTTPGPNGSIILDDTYNANATSSIAALDLMAELAANRKIAVLGDMAELGVETENEHRKVGRRVVEVVNLLITLGPKARLIAEEATAVGFDRSAIISLDSAETLFEQLNQIAAPGDMILIKGSRSLRLESIVARLTATSAEAT